ncbi:hypothetical protein [Treponema zioleckii]|uniref:hypothetical protein n=1 Tax=Treponema zioleckii TaxID=331680 RepID=UPI00168A9EA6|nr:hypothetical protein [Treponema zioleckii]
MLDPKTKKTLVTYSSFFAILVFMTSILVLVVIKAQDSWKEELGKEMQAVLDKYPSESYIVDKYIPLNSTISTSAAAYSLLKVGAAPNEKYYGVIVRIPSLIGPVPAVFLCHGKNCEKVDFAGFAVDLGKAVSPADSKISAGSINYWKQNVTNIIKKTRKVNKAPLKGIDDE